MAAREKLPEGGEIQFKDITFFLNKLGKIQTDVTRNDWTIPITNDIEAKDASRFKPRSFKTLNNSFSGEPIRRIQFKPRFNDNPAGNMTLFELDNYIFIFDLKLKEEFRGKGGGTLMMDLFKGVIILTDKDWAGGFIGDGNTEEFLKAQGFSRAEFETWTNNLWTDKIAKGEFVTDGNYYKIPKEERFGLVPTPVDIISKFGKDAVETPNQIAKQWTRELEQMRIKEGVPGKEGEIIFDARIRQDAADPFWEGGWSTWFKIPSRMIEYEDNIFPITSRRAPILDRFRDPTFSIFPDQ